LEKSWYECLGYPLRAWPLVLAMAAAMTLLTIVAALLLPRALALAEIALDAEGILVALVTLLGCLTAVAYVCGWLDCVLASAAEGEAQQVRWPGGHLLWVYQQFLGWALAF